MDRAKCRNKVNGIGMRWVSRQGGQRDELDPGVDLARAKSRVFLFLQGPHGPFFSTLSRELQRYGASCRKIGFTISDQLEWSDRKSYEAFRGHASEWPVHIRRRIRDLGVTDIVLYGDERAYHKEARRAAGDQVKAHCFEEGYLRPYWITYERGGVNGNSRLMETPLPEILDAVKDIELPLSDAPARWGSSFAHTFWSLLHHFPLWIGDSRYPHYARHRDLPLGAELLFYLKRLAIFPRLISATRLRETKLRRSGGRYHVALLQLAFDSSMKAHSDYETVAGFVEECVDGFLRGAPTGDKLVLKAHPFDDGRENLDALARRVADRPGARGRVVFLEGGRLAPLLDGAESAVTINSTSAHQALWRGMPVRAMGRAVYNKPGLTSRQSLDAFFAAPTPPDPEFYEGFRRFLLMTSQIEGGFYRTDGRRAAARGAAPLMLAERDPYDIAATVAPKARPETIARAELCEAAAVS